MWFCFYAKPCKSTRASSTAMYVCPVRAPSATVHLDDPTKEAAPDGTIDGSETKKECALYAPQQEINARMPSLKKAPRSYGNHLQSRRDRYR